MNQRTNTSDRRRCGVFCVLLIAPIFGLSDLHLHNKAYLQHCTVLVKGELHERLAGKCAQTAYTMRYVGSLLHAGKATY